VENYLSAVLDSLDDPSYNIVINTAPVNVPNQSGYHWYMEVIPRLIVTAGVEYAIGFYMNPVAPEIAADFFRQHLKKLGGQSEQMR
jgi:UDPglucose--hexose-1-phosphate uridylyltransferase